MQYFNPVVDIEVEGNWSLLWNPLTNRKSLEAFSHASSRIRTHGNRRNSRWRPLLNPCPLDIVSVVYFGTVICRHDADFEDKKKHDGGLDWIPTHLKLFLVVYLGIAIGRTDVDSENKKKS